jgi:hypothetical protein
MSKNVLNGAVLTVISPKLVDSFPSGFASKLYREQREWSRSHSLQIRCGRLAAS